MKRQLLAFAVAGLVLAGCGKDQPPAEQAAAPESAAPAVAGAPPPVTDHGFGPEISAEDFAAHVQTLASDEFGGRAPGSPGEERTVEYIKSQFERLGLKPGNGDSWFQTVPMVETTADPSTTATLTQGGQTTTLNFGDQMVVGTRTAQPTVEVKDSQIVFVGYGVNAPERNWNDYDDIDVKGKTVLILVNDPGFHVGDEQMFEGNRMTYYGRWTYKYEEAARQGAAAAIIIHDTPGAGYGWEVVKNSWSGAQFDLPTSVDPEPRLPVQGWITGEVAEKLLADSKLTLQALVSAASKPDFKAIPLETTFSVTVNSTIREAQSQNVLGLLPGTARPDEAVIYMAHWDHLGDHGHEGETSTGDSIFNGAIDNATGVAGILEIAEAFVTQQPAPERSVLFLAVTLEESGLLGAKYYAANPVIPLNKTVAVVNLDAMPVVGPTRDFVVVGKGNSELEDILAPIAAAQDRVLVEEAEPSAGYYFRSDHFAFAKAGVPALYAKGGIDHREQGKAYGKQLADDYRANRYHKPGDHFDPSWDMRGVVEDLNALYGVGREIAGSERWPNWYEGNAFRAAREASMASVK